MPVRPHTRRRYLIPTRSLKTLVRFNNDLHFGCPYRPPIVPAVYLDALHPVDTPIIWTSLTGREPLGLPSLARIKPPRWAGRVLATLFARNFGARPGCPASDHPLTLGVRPSLGPLRWSKQAETWPDPRTS